MIEAGFIGDWWSGDQDAATLKGAAVVPRKHGSWDPGMPGRDRQGFAGHGSACWGLGGSRLGSLVIGGRGISDSG